MIVSCSNHYELIRRKNNDKWDRWVTDLGQNQTFCKINSSYSLQLSTFLFPNLVIFLIVFMLKCRTDEWNNHVSFKNNDMNYFTPPFRTDCRYHQMSGSTHTSAVHHSIMGLFVVDRQICLVDNKKLAFLLAICHIFHCCLKLSTALMSVGLSTQPAKAVSSAHQEPGSAQGFAI